MTKSTVYGLITTKDIITNYFEKDGYLNIVYRNGDDYEKTIINNYNGIDFMNNNIDLPNYSSEIDNIIKDKKIFCLKEIKELLEKYRSNLPIKLIDYYYSDENLALVLFFEYLYEEMIEENASLIYIFRE